MDMNKRVEGQEFDGTHESYLEIRYWLKSLRPKMNVIITWFPTEKAMSVVDDERVTDPRSYLLREGDWMLRDTCAGEIFITMRPKHEVC